MTSSFFSGLSLLFGTIVGAGVFALPYVIAKSGALLGLVWLGVLGALMATLHVCYGEVCLRTEGRHRLVGYASIYLGRWGKIAATLSALVGTAGALLAYVILGGVFGQALFSRVVPWSSQMFAVLFWLICSWLVWQKAKKIARAELIMNVFLVGSILLLIALSLPMVRVASLPLANIRFLFLPYGVFLFALSGGSAIPEILDLLKTPKEKRSLRPIILACFSLVLVLYLLFSFTVAGVSGDKTSQDAITGLRNIVGEGAVLLGSFFGLFAVATSFLVLGEYLKNTCVYDYGMRPISALLCATGVPLILFLAGAREFILVIGITGTIMGVLEGVLVMALFQKAKNRGTRIPEYSVALGVPYSVFIALALVGGGVAYLWFF